MTQEQEFDFIILRNRAMRLLRTARFPTIKYSGEGGTLPSIKYDFKTVKNTIHITINFECDPTLEPIDITTLRVSDVADTWTIDLFMDNDARALVLSKMKKQEVVLHKSGELYKGFQF